MSDTGTKAPAMWARLVGQDAVVHALRDAAAAGKVGHALLFAGPEGVGRRLAALALAASLNCPQGGCGECAICAKVLRGAHPDVHLIVPEGQFILIGQIKGDGTNRGVIGEAYRSAIEGKTKVFVIEDAERMNLSAANALLKVLEEPPAGVVFVLMTGRPEDLPETIVSRCRRLDFSLLPETAIRRVLEDHHGIDPAKAAWAARIGGNLARALRLAHDPDAPDRYASHRAIPARLSDKGLSEAIRIADELRAEAEHVTARLRARQAEQVAEAAEAEGESPRGRGSRGSAAIRKRMETRHKREVRRAELDAIQAALDDIGSWYRDALVRTAGGDRTTMTPAGMLGALDRIEWSRRALERNAAAGLVLEALLSGLATSRM
ncbi:MAG TPA: DNA polymerase III subunit delta' [Actinomycetota bacterium]